MIMKRRRGNNTPSCYQCDYMKYNGVRYCDKYKREITKTEMFGRRVPEWCESGAIFRGVNKTC